jgi:hypothetical protein
VRTRIPVSCVEERRWSGKERTFTPGGISAYPSLRAVLASSVTDSLIKCGSFLSDQSLVWRSVRQYLELSKVSSPTLSMHDIYSSFKDTISTYMEELDGSSEKIHDNFKGSILGFVAFAGDRSLGMELFASLKFFEKFKKKLVSGYVLEALTRFSTPTRLVETDEMMSWVRLVLDREYKTFSGVANGNELRFKDDSHVARAIYDDERFLHLSAFTIPDLDGGEASKN